MTSTRGSTRIEAPLLRTVSSGSARITWLDREAARRAVARAVRRLARRRPEIERVLLFGSLARGDAVPGSDADLLLVLDGSDLSFFQRMPRYLPDFCGIGMDVFPYTAAELERMKAGGNAFIRAALAEGRVVFRRRASPWDRRSPGAASDPR